MDFETLSEDQKKELWYQTLPKICIILGAGASVEAGYPLYTELTDPQSLQRRFSYFSEKTGEKKDIIKKCESIAKYNMHFEELMNSSVESGDTELQNKLLDYYEDILTFPEYHIGEDQKSYMLAYLRFFVLIAPLQINVLTFNHDLLVEYCTKYAYRYETGGSIFSYTPVGVAEGRRVNAKEWDKLFEEAKRQYGDVTEETFSKIFYKFEQGKHHDFKGDLPQVVLHKLHGSINMKTCQTCGSTVYSSHAPLTDRVGFYVAAQYCPVCDSKDTTFRSNLLPPLKGKDASPLFGIWDKAKKVLSESSLIQFVGYSMPSYDKESIELFKHISPDAEIEVIDPGVNPSLISRYEQFLTGKKTPEFHKKTLSEYTYQIYSEGWGYYGNFTEFWDDWPILPEW